MAEGEGELTLYEIARFCSGGSALVYDAVCREYDKDPAAGIEDDFLAYQMRLGLLTHRRTAEANQSDDGDEDREMREAVRTHHQRMQETRRQFGV